MSNRYIILAIALLSFCSATLSQQYVPRKDDILGVIYEFTLTADGKAHNIKFVQAFWQKDKRNAPGIMTDAEKARGASVIAAHPYHPRSNEVGKKRYDAVLFDTKSRTFNWGIRP